MRELKIGDRIRLLAGGGWPTHMEGAEVTIGDMSSVGGAFPDPDRGHGDHWYAISPESKAFPRWPWEFVD